METANQKRRVAVPAAETAALVIFGLDDQKKPHASAFVSSQSDLAQKAAALMGMKLFHPKSEEEHALAVQLPRGRIFGSGRAFVPFVASANYKRLCEFAGLSATAPPKTQEIECPAPASPDEVVVAMAADELRVEAPGDREVDLAPGAVVLACENRDSGFFEAIVVRIDGEVLTLRWEFWPKLPVFTRRCWQVAPLPDRKPYW
jgi:hypothetical protein